MSVSKMRKPKYFTSWEDVPIVLDISTVAIILGMPYETVRKYVVKGVIPASKIGSLWRITKDSLMTYLDVQREKPLR